METRSHGLLLCLGAALLAACSAGPMTDDAAPGADAAGRDVPARDERAPDVVTVPDVAAPDAGPPDTCVDMDLDGVAAPPCGNDCDDRNREVRPGATEACNGRDDDCNGMVDDGLGSAMCGVGACERTVARCAGGVAQTCTPGAPTAETCNGRDDDCNGMVDDGLAAQTCGVGACRRMQPACVGGMTAMCMPGAPSAETCNGVDDNCNGAVDEGVQTTCYRDGDGDGYAPVGAMTMSLCGACPSGFTARVPAAGAADCNDGVAAVRPGATEVQCNALDDDCNPATPDLFTGTCFTGPGTMGVGVCAAGSWACSGGARVCGGQVTASSEVCDGRDNNCNGTLDDGFACSRGATIPTTVVYNSMSISCNRVCAADCTRPNLCTVGVGTAQYLGAAMEHPSGGMLAGGGTGWGKIGIFGTAVFAQITRSYAGGTYSAAFDMALDSSVGNVQVLLGSTIIGSAPVTRGLGLAEVRVTVNYTVPRTLSTPVTFRLTLGNGSNAFAVNILRNVNVTRTSAGFDVP